MKILQGGYPKSGNYWLYKIIGEVLKEAGIERKSFIKNHPIYQLAKTWTLSYPEQADIDMLDIQYVGYFYRVSSRYREKLEGEDISMYINESSQIWTHSNYCKNSDKVFKKVNKRVYIVRDPRDVAVSSAQFAFTPYMQKHYPTFYKTPADFLEAEMVNIIKAWSGHVLNYLEYASQNDLYIIFYEQLLQNFDQALENLLKYFEIDLSQEQQARVKRKVSFENMKKESPEHVYKAELYNWTKNLNKLDQSLVLQNARSILNFLHYPETIKDIGQLPKLTSLNKRKLIDLKDSMDDRALVEQLRDMIEEVRS